VFSAPFSKLAVIINEVVLKLRFRHYESEAVKQEATEAKRSSTEFIQMLTFNGLLRRYAPRNDVLPRASPSQRRVKYHFETAPSKMNTRYYA
jgi:hypothetical protein